MEQANIDLAVGLRQRLHACAEVSGHETVTKRTIMEFLREHTDLELVSCGQGFYAAHREPGAVYPSVALRADYDALATPDGGAAHLCGHDGHSAALCLTALEMQGKTYGRNVFLLFQPSEETGEGGRACAVLMDMEKIGRIFGCHNLPGFERGQVYTAMGPFACASLGLTIRLQGKAAHAAYPEYGLSPASAVGELLTDLPSISAPDRYTGMVMCTVIGVRMGEKAFGAAAADAEIWLTLRGEHGRELKKLTAAIISRARDLAAAHGLGYADEQQDVFPATENDPACAKILVDRCGARLLKEPMRWSEDFGHYLEKAPGAFFGIGDGPDWPALHTAGYEYPDGLLDQTAAVFLKLIAEPG